MDIPCSKSFKHHYLKMSTIMLIRPILRQTADNRHLKREELVNKKVDPSLALKNNFNYEEVEHESTLDHLSAASPS
jgi:hypothetical protein